MKAPLSAIVLLLSVFTQSAPAAQTRCYTCLGVTTQAVTLNDHFPLSGFHRISDNDASSHKPQILFIGTQLQNTRLGQDIYSATERWPLTKALLQFGTLHNLSLLPRLCVTRSSIRGTVCDISTLDLRAAHYTSRYVAFREFDILNTRGLPLDRLSGNPLALYNAYSRIRGSIFKHDYLNVLYTLLREPFGHRRLPLITIGDYGQTVDQILVPGVLQKTAVSAVATPGTAPSTYYTGLSFTEVQRQLIHSPSQTLGTEINAEANVMIAAICHSTHNRPAHVCNRPVIRKLAHEFGL